MGRCIGYGDTEGTCQNEAGTSWTPYWCLPCDEVRRATITEQFHALLDEFAGADGEASDG